MLILTATGIVSFNKENISKTIILINLGVNFFKTAYINTKLAIATY